MKCNSLIYYSDLALPQEDNDFVANFLREGSKIIEEDINKNSQEKYKIEIDFLHVEKGDKGVNEIIKKLNSYDKLFFSNAHTIGKYNKEILYVAAEVKIIKSLDMLHMQHYLGTLN